MADNNLTTKRQEKIIEQLGGDVTTLKTNLESERWDVIDELATGGTDTSDATATAEDITEGKTAYVKDEKLTGINPMSKEEYNACMTLVNSIDNLEDYTDTTATAEDIAEGKTAYSNGERLYGTGKSGIISSPTEPTGSDRKLIWAKKSRNLLTSSVFGYTNGNKVRTYTDSTGNRTRSEGANSWAVYRVPVPESCIGKEVCLSFNGYSNQDYSVQYMIHNQVRLMPTNDFNVVPTEEQYCILSKTDKRYSIKFVATQNHMYMIHDLAESNMSTTELKTYNHQLEFGSEPSEYAPYVEPVVYIKTNDDIYKEAYDYINTEL